MDICVCGIEGVEPDVSEVIRKIAIRHMAKRKEACMVCDEDPVIHRNIKGLGKYIGSSMVDGECIDVYQKDVEEAKKTMHPYNDGVAKMLLDDSPQGDRLLSKLMKEICDVDVKTIQHQDCEIYLGDGIYPDKRMDRFMKINDEYLVNLEMQQHINGLMTMELRIVNQHSTVLLEKDFTQYEVISIWFMVKDTMVKDKRLIHCATLDWHGEDGPVRSLPYGRIYIVEMNKVKGLEVPGSTWLERYCQFMLHYKNPKKKALMEQLKEDEIIMDSVKRVDAFHYDVKEICRIVKKRLDEMSIKEVREESIDKGIKIGEKKGKELTIRETIQQMYYNGITIDKICQIMNKTPKEVKKIIQCEKACEPETSLEERKVLEA